MGVRGSVRLLGHRTDARHLLDAADVFVLPSRHEGMPLAAIEAMEAGLPVVATHVIGSRRWWWTGRPASWCRPRTLLHSGPPSRAPHEPERASNVRRGRTSPVPRPLHGGADGGSN